MGARLHVPAELPRLAIGATPDGKAFTLPLDTATLARATFGLRGSGKTSTEVAGVEELLDAGQQVVVIDPVNVWWGLRSSFDGKAPGYAIPILGGPYGDVELTPEMGVAVADWVVETRSSAIISLRHLSKGRQRKFAQEFLEQLYLRKGEPGHQTSLTLVIDEASQFVPQRVGPDVAHLVGAVENCVRQGRSAGIGIVLIDQRPASVNKDALTQAEMLVCHRVTGPHDRRALKEWTDQHDAEGHQGEFLRTLASLPQGRAWVWIPLDGVFAQVQVRRRRTFDSSRTPKTGEPAPTPPKVRAEVEIRELRRRLRDALEHAAQNDPAKLRARIAELESMLSDTAVPVAAAPPAADVAAAVDAATAPLRAQVEMYEERMRTAILSLTGQLQPEAREPSPPTHVQASPRTSPELHDAAIRRLEPAPAPSRRPAPAALPEGVTLSTSQLKILGALATFRTLGLAKVARSVIAVFAEQSPRSSGYANNLGALRTAGLIDYPMVGFVALTPQGERVAPNPERVATLSALLDRWCAILTRPQQAILRAVAAIPRYPEGRSITREALARQVGQSPTSSGFANNLGALRTLGVIAYPEAGRVAATDLLFPKGLR